MVRTPAEEKVECRTPNPDRPGTTKIPVWKFDAVSKAITSILKRDNSVAFKDLPDLVDDMLSQEERDRLGSLGWHVTTIKLEMEVRGDIVRTPGNGPQHIQLP